MFRDLNLWLSLLTSCITNFLSIIDIEALAHARALDDSASTSAVVIAINGLVLWGIEAETVKGDRDSGGAHRLYVGFTVFGTVDVVGLVLRTEAFSAQARSDTLHVVASNSVTGARCSTSIRARCRAASLAALLARFVLIVVDLALDAAFFGGDSEVLAVPANGTRLFFV